MMKKTTDSSVAQELQRLHRAHFTGDLLKHSIVRTYDRNEPLLHQGATVSHLLILLAGKARIVQQEPNGKTLILQFLEPGNLIGELTLVQAEEEAKDVVAIDTVRCLAIPMPEVEKMLRTDPAFSAWIAKYIGEKLLLRMTHFSNAQTFELKYRLAALLIEVSVNGQYCEKNTQIADYLGVSYRHLTHTFKYLREEGYIEKNKRGYRIDVEKLRALVQVGNDA